MNDLIIPTLGQHLQSRAKTRAQQMADYIAAHQGCTVVEIAQGVGIPRPNASSQLADMVRFGQILRAGLRGDYAHFTDRALWQQRKDWIAAEQRANRNNNAERRAKRANAARAKRRAEAIKAGRQVRKLGDCSKPREQRIEGRAQAYIDAHQGCLSSDIRTGTGMGKNSVSWAMSKLMEEGAAWRVGALGSNSVRYYTGRAVYEQAQAAHEAAQVQKASQKATQAAERKATDAQARNEAERMRIAAREAMQLARETERAAAKAERERQAAESKAKREREADARRLKREAEEAARKERAAQRVAPKPASPAVRAPAQVWANEEPIYRDGIKVTVVPAPRGRYEADIKPGQGAISADYVARRQGQFVPSRLVGSYA